MKHASSVSRMSASTIRPTITKLNSSTATHHLVGITGCGTWTSNKPGEWQGNLERLMITGSCPAPTNGSVTLRRITIMKRNFEELLVESLKFHGMIPMIKKHCFVACPEGRPCSCRSQTAGKVNLPLKDILYRFHLKSGKLNSNIKPQIMLDSTHVQMTCISKKEIKQYPTSTPSFEIELEVPYDQTSIFYKLSGGTNMVLRTVNEQAAAMFATQGKYMMVISPVPQEEKGE